MNDYIPKPSPFDPDEKGQFGIFGGQYVPETLRILFFMNGHTSLMTFQ